MKKTNSYEAYRMRCLARMIVCIFATIIAVASFFVPDPAMKVALSVGSMVLSITALVRGQLDKPV